MDRFNDMQLFCSVVEKGNFAKTAKAIGVTPAIVGRRIAAMEDHLGFILFNRTTRSMKLTPVGLSYYKGAKQLINQAIELEESLTSEHHKKPSGKIRLSAPDEFGSEFLIPVIQDFNKRHPQISFELITDNQPVNLIEEEMDLSFRFSFDLQDTSYVASKLTSTPLSLFASPQYLASKGRPKGIADLINHDCLTISLNRDEGTWSLFVDGKIISHKQPWKLAVSDSRSLLNALSRGMGLCIVPRIFCQSLIEEGKVVEIKGVIDTPMIGIYVMYPNRKHVPYRVRLFIDFIKGWFNPVY
ncbi:LysR family transcriptional regulator [Vibrio mediterranei]|uniref:LysR family transcriptional regulator n=1 Tax=Vibrio mediterranei TaxID=689 RepID=UPI001EFDC006|nr:LysR family transcriptional regulator [Vibrio mediterranei]MCG9629039.1 LysR family transcriptional regulator [Vibrio mediterranei]